MSGVVVQTKTKRKRKYNRSNNNNNNDKNKMMNDKLKSYANKEYKPKNLDDYYSALSQKVDLKEVVNHRFSVLGIDIEFPFPPYGIQKAMMNKIIAALSNKQHCLIESPTGTGKTLVLVCSVLAWQKKSTELLHPFVSKKYQDKIRENRQDKKGYLAKPCTCGRRPNKCKQFDNEDEQQDGNCAKKTKLSFSPPSLKENEYDNSVINLADDDDDDCRIVEESDAVKMNKSQNNESYLKDVGNNPAFNYVKPELCQTCLAFEAEKTYLELCGDDSQEGFSTSTGDRTGVDSEVRKCKIPRIYYGTRTHKQISQVIREVNKTEYRSKLNMTILSSRDRTCINDEVKDLASRNDRCRELVFNGREEKNTKPTCRYYQDNQTREVAFLALQDYFDDRAFDIEEAGNFGREHTTCPFYGLRSIQSRVNITFCPYNYILDPTIRQAMNINLKDSIIILDEAHNIEDTCRDSASFNITSKHIEDITECIKIALNQNEPGNQNSYDALNFFKNLLSNIQLWMRRQQFENSFQNNGADWSKSLTYEGPNMTCALESVDLGWANLATIKSNLNILKGGDDGEEAKEQNKARDQPALNANQMQVIGKMALALEYMYSDERKLLETYKMVLTRSLEREPQNKPKDLASASQPPKQVYDLSLFCMSPAVAFGKVRDQAWSIIVASGTLSPLESLKTELGTSFDCTFEGMHVIRQEQIFATIIERGPGGLDLNCSWERSQQFNFQDEVGEIVLDVCRKVPNGVLCFFPSYDRMEKLYNRWFQKGYISQIRRIGKSIHRESKELSIEEFEHDLQEYNREAEQNGALLFAVFRGKVSEGIDFADKAARAVITIGIPFPNTNNVQVNLKKRYNDEIRRIQPSIMSGSDWYSSQAFRALNQALGRCIRHQNDWGAILMIDSRLSRYKSSISRWLRQLSQVCGTYQQVSNGLDRFIAARTALPDEIQII